MGAVGFAKAGNVSDAECFTVSRLGSDFWAVGTPCGLCVGNSFLSFLFEFLGEGMYCVILGGVCF